MEGGGLSPGASAASRDPEEQTSVTSKRQTDDEDGGRQPPRKIQRVSRACDACKLRKGRCSGTNPCTSCVSKGIHCEYLTKYGRGRPPTPPPVTPGPDAACRVFGQSGPGIVPGSGSTHSPPRRDSLPGTLGQDNGWHAEAGSSHQTPIPSRASPEAGMTEIHGQYFDPTSGLAFIHRAWKRLSNHQPRDVDEGVCSSVERHQPQVAAGDKPFEVYPDGPLPVPDRADAQQLFAFYFDVCIATYRFLHRPTVQHWMDRVLTNIEQQQPMAQGVGESRTGIVFVIWAIAIYHRGQSQRALSAEEEALSTRRSDQLFETATQLADTATGFPSLESVQARLIQVLYLLHTSRMNQAWYVFGRALQMNAALGLHRREGRTRNVTAKTAQVDYIKSQCQKRTFWVAYILDQYLGVIFGRPRHYHDDDIDQSYPDSVDDEDMTPEGPKPSIRQKDCGLSCLIFHAQIGRICGKISREIYSIKPLPRQVLVESVGRFTAELAAWKAQLPPFLGAINPSSLVAPFRRQAVALRLAHSHSIMHAKRPFLLRNLGGGNHPSHGPAKENIADCLAAARLVLEMVDGMASDGTLFHAFWWTHYVTFISLSVVYVFEIQKYLPGGPGDDLSDQPDQERLFELAERCQTYLAEATATNSPNRRYSIILQELREEAKQRTAGAALHSLSQHPQNPNGLAGAEQEGAVPDPESGGGGGQASGGVGPYPNMPAGDMAHGIGMQYVWENWQTTDWLDIDSLVFGHFAGLESSPGSWLADVPSSHQLV